MLAGKKIILGITGSIAAYKSIQLLRLLVKEGAEVRVVATPAAAEFAPFLTLSTLSHHPVTSGLFDESGWSNHVELGRWADLMIIAPLSCNTLAKMAHGQCDNILLAVYLSAICPVLVAPAMDEDMWHHPSTKQNIERIQGYGNQVIPVEKGELASGLFGDGRMAEPESIKAYIETFFTNGTQLAGKKVLVTAGPTYEAIDPVRFIGNHSSGKMGIAIAKECYNRGAQVTLVLGPVVAIPSLAGVDIVSVRSAAEMLAACTEVFDQSDISIMAAAVADYTPVEVAKEKIKKKEDGLELSLTKTTDILKTLGQRKRSNQLLVGFALETNNELANAKAKLESKNADMIVLNSMADKGAGFGGDTNKITIITKTGKQIPFNVKDKQLVAKDIIDTLIALQHD